jgi:hypothetical protein
MLVIVSADGAKYSAWDEDLQQLCAVLSAYTMFEVHGA